MNSSPLTIEAFCKSPSLCGPSPSGLKLAPDGSCLTFLRGRADNKDYCDLWRLPLTDDTGLSITNPQPSLFVDADRLGLSGSDGSELSAEEKARRERMRVAQSTGILQYYWSGNSEYILLPAGNALWMYQVSSQKLELLPVSALETKGAVIDAQLSPDSTYVSYLREDNNLYVFHLLTKREIAITTDGTDTIRSGVAEFVAQEEMSRMTGYWWSPNTKYLAFTRIDESYVENVQRNEVYADGVRMTHQRYPYAGKQNVRLQLGVVDFTRVGSDDEANASSKLWMPLSKEEGTHDFYIPRVKWVSCGKDDQEVLSYQYQTRDQKVVKLKLAQIEQGFSAVDFESFEMLEVPNEVSERTTLGRLLSFDYTRTLLTEYEPNAFVNLVGDSDLYFCSKNEQLASKKIFFWLSERETGFKSIFMGSYAKTEDGNDTTLYRLTDKMEGNGSSSLDHQYVVDNLEFVDENHYHLYFTGRMTSPIEKHLYRLDFRNCFFNGLHDCSSPITQVTVKKGFHSVSFSANGDIPLYIDGFSSHEQPPQYSLCRAATHASDFNNPEKNAEFITWIEENNFKLLDHPLCPFYNKLNVSPEFGVFLADDEKTEIWYKLFIPSDEVKQQRKQQTGSDKLPCLVYVYGGPHVQVCSTASSWRDQSFFLQYFVQQGFIVLSVDNRGSSARGLKFESSIYLNAGQCEVSDQVKGVEKVLLSRNDVDADRICMYGHSYGGYMSLMCLFRAYKEVSTNKCGFYRIGEDAVFNDRKPLFRCSIAGAPVSRWDLYDTHYTERYMGIPSNDFGIESEFLDCPDKPFFNKKGYAHSRVHEYVKYYNDSESRLLMYHGMADDNVLFQHSTEIYKLLIDSSKLFSMIDYPGAKHGMSGEKTKIHLYRSIWEFVKKEMT